MKVIEALMAARAIVDLQAKVWGWGWECWFTAISSLKDHDVILFVTSFCTQYGWKVYLTDFIQSQYCSSMADDY